MEKEEQKLEQTEVEEQEEEETTLIVRKSRNANDSKTTEVAAFDVENGHENGVSVGKGHAIQSEVAENGAENEELIPPEIEQKMEKLNGVLENETEAIIGEQESQSLVFYDNVEGVESTSTCFREKQILKDPGPNGFDFSSLDFVVQNNSASAINNRNEGETKKDSVSSSNLQLSQNSLPEGSTSYVSSKEVESAEIDPINEDDLEVTDLDVERVLHKQTTHDLYCPNCNSCITKRVILRKRKRRVQIPGGDVKQNEKEKRRVRIPGGDVKQNESETAVDSSLATGSAQSPGFPVSRGDDAQIPTATEDQRDREPELFRCLSCFSFFIPTGSGSKLLTFIFGSNMQETVVGQGSSSQTVVQRGDVVTSSSNLGDQPSLSQKPRSPPHASEGLSATTDNNDTKEGGDSILNFPKQKPSVVEQAAVGVGDKLDTKATDTIDQLMESNSSQEVHVDPASDPFVTSLPMRTNGEFAEDAKGGLKLLIPRNKGSSMLDNSKEVQTPNQTVQPGVAGQVYPPEMPQLTKTKIKVHPSESLKDAAAAQGKDAVIMIDPQPAEPSQIVQGINHPTESVSVPVTQVSIADNERTEARKEFQIEVIKSIVYGGLTESITSLSVVSSAAGGGAATLNVLALGAANFIGGLFVIFHSLWDLKNDHIEQLSNQITEQRDRYRELLGQRRNFILHAIMAIISYTIFGLVPPVVYGFSFHKSDDKQLKLVVVAAAALLCILILAIAKAYAQRPPKPYLKTVTTYVILGFMVSGASYAGGELVERLLEKLGLFQTSSVPNVVVSEMRPTGSGWSSY